MTADRQLQMIEPSLHMPTLPTYTLLRKDLREAIPAPVWPPGTRLGLFDAGEHGGRVHSLLVEAYARGGGQVGPFSKWWAALRGDPEYDPSVVFLALDAQDRVIGIALCWTSAFLKDLAVCQAWRRLGLGQALLLQAFTAFRARGAQHFDLKVEDTNPYGAERLYRLLGMEAVV